MAMADIGSLSPVSAAAVQLPVLRPLALATVVSAGQAAQLGQRLLLLAREVALAVATALLGLLLLQAVSGVASVVLGLLPVLRRPQAAAAGESRPDPRLTREQGVKRWLHAYSMHIRGCAAVAQCQPVQFVCVCA